MKIALLADIHANWPALSAVLEDAASQGIDPQGRSFWSLGDVIGYGPHPEKTLEFLRDHAEPQAWVLGNHEAMLADLVLPGDVDDNKENEHLIRVTTQKGEGEEVSVRGVFMSSEDWAITNSSPVQTTRLTRACLNHHPSLDVFWKKEFRLERKGPLIVQQDGVDYSLVHGGHADPFTRLVYGWHVDILMPQEFKFLQERRLDRGVPQVQCFAHTHVPTLAGAREVSSGTGFEIHSEKVWPNETYELDRPLTLLNPGSVGQPRNLDRRACYAILDTDRHTVTFRRVEYDWMETGFDMQRGDYPSSVITRLKTAAAAEKETPDDWLEYYREASKR